MSPQGMSHLHVEHNFKTVGKKQQERLLFFWNKNKLISSFVIPCEWTVQHVVADFPYAMFNGRCHH